MPIIDDLLYIAHEENDQAIADVMLLGLSMAGGVLILTLGSTGRAFPDLWSIPELIIGFVLGGGLANTVEAQFEGSVTDFVGVGPKDLYSAGDLSMAIGLSLCPILAGIVLGRQRRQARGWGLSAVMYFAIVVVGLARPHQLALSVVALIVLVLALTTFLIRRLFVNRRISPALPPN